MRHPSADVISIQIGPAFFSPGGYCDHPPRLMLVATRDGVINGDRETTFNLGVGVTNIYDDTPSEQAFAKQIRDAKSCCCFLMGLL